MRTKTEIQEITTIRRQQMVEEFLEKLDWAINAAAYNGEQRVELELPEHLKPFCPQIVTRYVELGFVAEWWWKMGKVTVQVSWED